MDIGNIPAGDNVPDSVNVVIEISYDQVPVKYEYDYDSGTLKVDRFIGTPMRYPGNYGFIPHTLSDDGDAVDVIVVTELPIQPGAFISARPVGVLMMVDEKGGDEKVVAVPTSDVTPYYDKIVNATDLPAVVTGKIEHFFTHYKDLEKGKWSKMNGWGDAEAAKKIIREGVVRYADKNGKAKASA